MPGKVSIKLVCVLAAFAFVGAFRLNAGGDDEAPAATAAATTLSPARASALRSDIVQPASPPVHARLAAAPGLPALHRAPAPPHRTHHVTHAVSHAAAPAPTAPPVVTPAPTAAPPVATAVPQRVVTSAPPPPQPKYVGKSFDSKG